MANAAGLAWLGTRSLIVRALIEISGRFGPEDRLIEMTGAFASRSDGGISRYCEWDGFSRGIWRLGAVWDAGVYGLDKGCNGFAEMNEVMRIVGLSCK